MAIEKKKCNKCEQLKYVTSFYSSDSIMFSDKKVPICKQCVKDMIDLNNIDTLKQVLQKIDKPFIASVWKSAEENKSETVGQYFKMINSFPQYKGMSYSDSVLGGEELTGIYNDTFDKVEEIDQLETEYGTIKVDKDSVIKFGGGFSKMEYLQMEKFYQEMARTHDINTPQLKQQLVMMCKVKTQLNRAIESGNSGDIKKLSDVWESLMKSSGFRPIDTKNSADSHNIKSFSQIFELVEQKGYIPPYNLDEDMDLVDRAIITMQNYTRTLMGLGKIDELSKESEKELHGDSNE